LYLLSKKRFVLLQRWRCSRKFRTRRIRIGSSSGVIGKLDKTIVCSCCLLFNDKGRDWFYNVVPKITDSYWGPGVDVMITIFCDLCQFSAKKLSFFSKTNVMIQFLHNLALFWAKNANFFAKFFGENILKIITSVPGSPTIEVMHIIADKKTRGQYYNSRAQKTCLKKMFWNVFETLSQGPVSLSDVIYLRRFFQSCRFGKPKHTCTLYVHKTIHTCTYVHAHISVECVLRLVHFMSSNLENFLKTLPMDGN
jgi:hypothetical protein